MKDLPNLRAGVPISRTHGKARQMKQLPKMPHATYQKRQRQALSEQLEQRPVVSEVRSLHDAQGDCRGITAMTYSLPSHIGACPKGREC